MIQNNLDQNLLEKYEISTVERFSMINNQPNLVAAPFLPDGNGGLTPCPELLTESEENSS